MLVNILQTFDDANGKRRFAGENPDVDPAIARQWIADGRAAADTDNTEGALVFPDLPTLIAAYPASSNAGKSAMAGPIMYVGDGAAWLPVSLAVVDDVIPSDSDVVQVSLNNSGSQVVGCGGMLLTIRCTTGASVVLTVVDNPFGSTGRTVYTGTLSAGDVVAVNGYALHGLYASTPGVGSFEFDHKGAF